MAKVSAEWVGVIVVGSFEMDCRLFSARGKAKPFPVRFVHTSCHTALEGIEVEEKERETEEKVVVSTEVVGVREQFFCPRCQRLLKTDEVSRGVETESGIIEISETEFEALKFATVKRVTAELINVDDMAIEAVGLGRRLYVMPKPSGISTYALVYRMLYESRRFGFISPFTIKEKPNVAVLKPLEIPETIFGKKRTVLVLDILNDTDRLKDPAELPDFFGDLPKVDIATLAQPIAEAQKVTARLDPGRCVNPKRRKLKEIVRQSLARSLKR